jgi:hypothetical protein
MTLDDRQPALTETEWELVVELLEREQKQLQIEIWHADRGSFRQQLRLRLDLVNQLLSRLEPASAA